MPTKQFCDWKTKYNFWLSIQLVSQIAAGWKSQKITRSISFSAWPAILNTRFYDYNNFISKIFPPTSPSPPVMYNIYVFAMYFVYMCNLLLSIFCCSYEAFSLMEVSSSATCCRSVLLEARNECACAHPTRIAENLLVIAYSWILVSQFGSRILEWAMSDNLEILMSIKILVTR